MSAKSIVTWLLVGLALLTMACQAFSNLGIGGTRIPTATPIAWPLSSFLPPQKSVRVPVGQPLQIDTLHKSPAQVATIQIFVNGQPLKSEATPAGASTFPDGLVNVQVRSGESLVQASTVTPEFPATEQLVSLVWVGYVPGVYDLSLVATDKANRTGHPIVQRIEVVEPAK